MAQARLGSDCVKTAAALAAKTRPSRAIGDMSPIPSITAVMLRRHERQKSAMCGRLRVGKENLHGASLVGAAMCSAC